MTDNKLTHYNDDGDPTMVDINHKENTVRVAVASGTISMKPETLQKILDVNIKKGEVLNVAKLAGIMASKKTDQLIPLCHSIPLSYVKVDLLPDKQKSFVNVIAEASLIGKTGVEMEAFTAVSIALLTIYDMCKAVDRGMVISDIKLMHKSGGKSGEFNANI